MKEKKLKISTVVNLILVAALVGVIGMGWFYFKGVSPVEVAVSQLPAPDILEYEFSMAIYDNDKGLVKPHSMLVFDNRVYVSENNDPRIVVFDLNGKHLSDIVVDGMRDPKGMFWDGTSLWVADAASSKVFVLTLDGTLQREIALEKPSMPVAITVDNGHLYVLDNATLQIKKIDLETEKVVATIGEPGSEDGQFYYPYSLKIHKEKLYVADSLNNRISIFDLEGKFITNWARDPEKDEFWSLAVPRGIAFDKKDRLYTVEGMGHVVAALDQEGKVLMRMADAETIDEEVMRLSLPTDVAVDELGRLYVLEFGNQRIVVYKQK